MTDIRAMTLDDVEGVMAVIGAADDDLERRAGREPRTSTEEQTANFRKGMQRFVERDPDGAWVAVDGDTVVGVAEAIRRGSFWGLAMLFVDPAVQSKGLGKRLLDASLTCAEGAEVRMIMSSPDPRALRRYALAGLAIHPGVEASGPIDRTAIPTDLPGRPGDASDLDLVAEVDEGLRGSRAEDAEFLLAAGGRLEVVDSGPGRGFAVFRGEKVSMLGATDDATAALLLWRVLAEAGEKTELWALTAAQDWAVQVALAARLKLSGSGALFLAGRDHPPGPWLPSGWYF